MSSTEQDLFIDVLMWNAPKLLSSSAPGARTFARLMCLSPTDLHEIEHYGAAVSLDPTPLQMASDGLRFELTGQPAKAEAQYAKLLELRGSYAVLGALLIAWMDGASPRDFERVEFELNGTDLDAKYAARVYSKLMLWSIEGGYRDQSRSYYRKAVELSRGDFKELLLREGHWYGAGRRIGKRPLRSEFIRYPWIQEYVLQATQTFMRESVANMTKPSEGYTWRFGGSGGYEIRAAKLQASWCGLTGLYRETQKTEASLVLNRINEDHSQVTEALSAWIKCSGSRIEKLVSRFEADFDSGTAAELLTKQLHSGASVPNRSDWIEVCTALWDQMPASLAKEIIETTEISPDRALLPVRPGTSEETLLAVLSARDRATWQRKFLKLSSGIQDVLVRSMSEGVAKRLPHEVLRPAAEAALDRVNAEQRDRSWNDTGWSAIAVILSRLGDTGLNQRYRASVPRVLIPFIALNFPELVSDADVRRELDVAISGLHSDRDAQSAGRYTNHVYDPADSAAACMLYLRVADKQAVELLVDLASSAHSRPFQAAKALKALLKLAAEGLVWEADVQRALVHAKRTDSAISPWEGPAEIRITEAQRSILKAHFIPGAVAEVTGACRDPEVRVRTIAVRAVVQMARSSKTSLFDATLLGALYDPEGSVQAIGARAFLDEDVVMDKVLKSVGQARLLDMWDGASRHVRVSIAVGAKSLPTDDIVMQLHKRIAADRSIMVRTAGDA